MLNCIKVKPKRTVYLSSRSIKHSLGQTTVGVYAYIARIALREAVGETLRNYENTKSNQKVLAVLTSNGADPVDLVRKADIHEWGKRRNHDGVPAQNLKIFIPSEIAKAGMAVEFTKTVQAKLRESVGLDSIAAIHSPEDGDENYHAHIITLLRTVSIDEAGSISFAKRKSTAFDKIGFSGKERKLDDGGYSGNANQALRKIVADVSNSMLEGLGHSTRYDHRTYYAQGLPLLKTWKESGKRTRDRRRGILDNTCKRNDLVLEYNSLLLPRLEDGKQCSVAESAKLEGLYTKIEELSELIKQEIYERKFGKREFDRFEHVDKLEPARRKIIAQRLAKTSGDAGRQLATSVAVAGLRVRKADQLEQQALVRERGIGDCKQTLGGASATSDRSRTELARASLVADRSIGLNERAAAEIARHAAAAKRAVTVKKLAKKPAPEPTQEPVAEVTLSPQQLEMLTTLKNYLGGDYEYVHRSEADRQIAACKPFLDPETRRLVNQWLAYDATARERERRRAEAAKQQGISPEQKYPTH